jgi:ABC-type molybdate transport system permease subunit
MNDERIPPTALILSLLGLIPFAACAFSLGTGVKIPVINDPALALVTYCAIILSFLGGVRWGFALRISDPGLQREAFLFSVVPSIVAWLLVLPPTLMGFILMPVLFVLMGLIDDRLPSIGVPVWYRKLRRIMTALVVLTLLAAIYGLTQKV